MSERASSLHVHIAPSEARDVLVALRNVEHLAKSPRVGQAVVASLLPEIIEGLPRLASFFHAMLAHKTAACEVGRLALESIGRVEEAAAAAHTAGARQSASARLRLERALGDDVPRLEACVEACEMWTRATAGRRVELTLRDVVESVLEPCAPADAACLWASLPAGDVCVIADAAVVLWLCRSALASLPVAAFVARSEGDGGPRLEFLHEPPVGDLTVAVPVPMRPRAPTPKVVYPEALASIAAAAGLRLDVAPGRMTLQFERASEST